MEKMHNIISNKITNDDEEIGWEEITNSNIIYQLKVLANREI
jgi:hypothetical protein